MVYLGEPIFPPLSLIYRKGSNMDDTRLLQFANEISRILGEKLISVILYGSTARGTASDDSDIDIAILLRSGITPEENDQLSDIIVDFNIDTGKVLSVIDITESDYLKWRYSMPFFMNLSKDGIPLWTKTA